MIYMKIFVQKINIENDLKRYILILRDYQNKTLVDSKKILKKENFAICGMFMGGGKSIIIAELAKYYSEEKKQSVVILLNISSLVFQLKDYFDKYNIDYEILKSGHTIKTNTPKVWIIMEQSYYSKKRTEIPIECDLLIKDEFHIGYCENKKDTRYSLLINYFKPKKIFGLTGTPFDKQGYLLEGITINNLILHGNVRELTEKGFLVPLKYYVPKWSENIDYSKVKKSNGDFSTKDLDKKINTLKHIQLISKSINEMNGKNKKTLVYANSIDNAININNQLIKDGFKSAVVHSKQDKKINDKIIKNFNLNLNDTDSINCLVSVSQLTTGYNQPKATLLVLCRPTEILSLYLQIIFRVARPYINKKFAEILDLSQSISRHGFGIEPRLFIKKPNKIGLNKEKNRVKLPVKHIVDEKPTLLNYNALKLKLKELKKQDLDLKNNQTNNLIRIFDIDTDIETIINIYFELKFRIKKQTYNENDIEKMIILYNKKYNNSKDKNSFIFKLKEELKNKIKN